MLNYARYRMRDGITKLSEQYFNPIWKELDARLGTLEELKVSWLDAVSNINNVAMRRVNDALLPLVDSAKKEAAELHDIFTNIGEVITRDKLNVALAEPLDTTFVYGADGRITHATYSIAGEIKAVSYRYTPNGSIDIVTTAFRGIERNVVYTYNDLGVLVGSTASERTL